MSESLKNNHVSIIVCHYSQVDDFGENRAKSTKTRPQMLRETLDSLIENTDYPTEVIIVDNGGVTDSSDYLLSLVREGFVNTYIRNKENMNFGWAWNQGAKLATGDYLCFTCNDLQFLPHWLSQTMEPLLKFPDKKLIASPLCTPDKDNEKYWRGFLNNHRLNAFAGSNCMVMHRNTFEDIGEFSTHRIAGTHWHQKMNKKGYAVVLPPENKALHLGKDGGTDYTKDITVEKTLLDGSIIDYSCKKS